MPFPFVYRIPQRADERTLLNLKRRLVDSTSLLMDCPKDWVGVELFKTTVDVPKDENDGCDTILIKLETGLFNGRSDDDELVQLVLKELSVIVWAAFDGEYEVEAAVNGWHPGWKYL